MYTRNGVNRATVLLASVSVCSVALAGPVLPGAGTLMQEIPQVQQAPSGDSIDLTLKPTQSNHSASTVSFQVKSIKIEGNTLINTGVLHDLVRDDEGKSLTLGQVQKDAQRITDYYRKKGYLLSRAVVPVQSFDDGVIRIRVIEAEYGKVSLTDLSKTGSRTLQSVLAPLKTGEPISEEELNRVLLLLSDIPGTEATANLMPGTKIGESDLAVVAASTPQVSGSVTADNYGNNYTGNARLSGAVTMNELLGIGDRLSVNGMTSGPGMNYAHLGYDILADGSGTRVGGEVSDMAYVLGGPLAGLQGQGTATISSLWVRQPLIRGTSVNLYGQAEFDYKRLSDQTVATMMNRHLDNGVLSLNGDERDGFMSGGVGLMTASLTSGRATFDNAAALSADTATAHESGFFGKWNGSISRLQNVGNEKTQLYLSATGQWAQKNLDPIEQMVVGGPYSVRGYDMGVLSADSGVLGTAEGRYRLTENWQAVVFGDSERVVINTNPFAPGANGATLSGAGIGMNWSSGGAWQGKFYLADRVGAAPIQLSGVPGGPLAWGELSRNF